MDQQQNKMSSQEIFDDIERRIRDNFFDNKETITKYVNGLQNNGFLTQEEIEQKLPELLGIYDNLNPNKDMPLQMDNYKGASIEDQNLIVGKEEGRVLTTESSPENVPQEFQNHQNQIMAANSKETPVEAPEIFAKMAERTNTESRIMSISEVLVARIDIDKEIWQKIKFFITSKYFDPRVFKVDPERGLFYNIETSEILEVKKDEATNQYQIYRNGQQVYEEELSQDAQKKEQGKVKVLKREPQYFNNNNAAFSKMNLLLLIIGIFAASIVYINILSKFIK